MAEHHQSLDVAIIGISCRFPGANGWRPFWTNLERREESVLFLADEAIEKDIHLLRNPYYIKAVGALDGFDRFDPEFFGIPAAMAPMMTPEHRLFIEHAWEAMEDAGYDSETYPGETGVYGACNPESIARYKLPPDWISTAKEVIEHSYGWCPDSIAPNVLRYLGLRGEAISLTTFCTGTHYAIHLACQSLLTGQTDLAIAGGVVVRIPHMRGYLWEEGGVLSRDGHCRPYAANGTGAALASGVAVFVLKPLHAAVRDRDHVYAVIKGSAINNNGRAALGYGVAQPDRLSACIAGAMALGDVTPDTVTMLEGFGVGHPLADAVEVKALTMAFQTDRIGYCSLGSVKGNLGNCGVAAGGAGIVKAALALHHREIPATLTDDSLNPALERTPFVVQRERQPWQPACGIRRAGVTAIAGSGYNAHIVLEEAPAVARHFAEPTTEVVALSARSDADLAAMRANLAAHLRHHPHLPLGDVALTLNLGRRRWTHRWAAVVDSVPDLIAALERSGDPSPPRADHRALQTLADAWTAGRDVDWARHHEGCRAHRVPLPTYPFARRRFWLASGQAC